MTLRVIRSALELSQQAEVRRERRVLLRFAVWSEVLLVSSCRAHRSLTASGISDASAGVSGALRTAYLVLDAGVPAYSSDHVSRPLSYSSSRTYRSAVLFNPDLRIKNQYPLWRDRWQYVLPRIRLRSSRRWGEIGRRSDDQTIGRLDDWTIRRLND